MAEEGKKEKWEGGTLISHESPGVAEKTPSTGYSSMEAVAWSLKLVLSTEQGNYFPTQWLFSTAFTAVAEHHFGLNWSVLTKAEHSVFNTTI